MPRPQIGELGRATSRGTTDESALEGAANRLGSPLRTAAVSALPSLTCFRNTRVCWRECRLDSTKPSPARRASPARSSGWTRCRRTGCSGRRRRAGSTACRASRRTRAVRETASSCDPSRSMRIAFWLGSAVTAAVDLGCSISHATHAHDGVQAHQQAQGSDDHRHDRDPLQCRLRNCRDPSEANRRPLSRHSCAPLAPRIVEAIHC